MPDFHSHLCLGQRHSASVNYRTDLFTAEAIARLCAQFEVTLHSVIASPDTAIADIEIYPKEDKEQRLHNELEQRKSQRSKLKATKRQLTAFPEKMLRKTNKSFHGK
jgi:hypothetical protein